MRQTQKPHDSHWTHFVDVRLSELEQRLHALETKATRPKRIAQVKRSSMTPALVEQLVNSGGYWSGASIFHHLADQGKDIKLGNVHVALSKLAQKGRIKRLSANCYTKLEGRDAA